MTTPVPFWKEVSREGGYAQVEVHSPDMDRLVITVPVLVLDHGDPSDAIRVMLEMRQSTKGDLRAAF